ncbi:MAG TPA: Ig-like domain-containing protein [Candidatus Sulfotelmatobacter sp.]|nr:Ig-like domain-containing protein [Candidatus Sulfotelmatobacter sp.]
MLVNKFRLIGSFAVLLTMALAAGCTGFFVNPTLTAISVGPQNLSINVNQQWQMQATGTYSDGSQKTLNSGVTWSSSDASTVSVGQSSGQVTGVDIGTATISASAGSCSACSGSTTVTVVLQGVTSITVTPSSQTVQIGGTPVYYKALANGSTDITNSGATTWQVLDSSNTDQTSNFTLGFVAGSGEGFLPNSSVTPGTYTVQATYNSVVGKAKLQVQ